jgi:dihydrofolate reductase
MRNVILKMDITVDGFVATRDGDVQPIIAGGWPDAMEPWLVDLLASAGTHVMGRVSYDDMSPYWPTSTSPFAKPMNEIPKVVFSTTLTESDWQNTTFASGSVDKEIARLREQPGGPILVHGGARLVQALNRAGLIDEYHLITHPVALGTGLPIFAERADLKLTKSWAHEEGVVLNSYARPV